ncbi:MAG: restriction endonuclease [Clostridiaceae bacterium]
MELLLSINTENECKTTEKGALLEHLAASVLAAQQYSVSEQVRITGMEVDVLAKHKYTGETIYVECKAHEESLSADTITKLLGNILLKGANAGWLITTGDLGKDAEGVRCEWEGKPVELKKQLVIYTRERVIETFIDNKIVVNPERLMGEIPDNFFYSHKCVLFITNLGRYWLVLGSTVSSGISSMVIPFDADTGKRITDQSLIKKLSSIKSLYSSFDWIAANIISNKQNVASEFDSISTVISGDAWEDYRPARPEDYVGRKDIIHSILDYYTEVLNKKTDIRLFALKSPSGWGKSSTIVKLIKEIQTHSSRKNYFLYAVDVRTAMSSRYAELAFKACCEKALEEGFIDIGKKEICVGEVCNITSTEDIQMLLRELKKEKKIIILVFDQFEEIFYKQELFDLFENVRKISNTIDSIKENIIVGFAWKTDFSISPDHPAYYLWSNLQDRRKEFDLFQFTDGEIKTALNIFGKVLGQNLNPILARYLTQQCQGYPWLLKKLCIHVFNIIHDGYKQEEAVKKALNIGDLFESELNTLTAEEHLCVQYIAKESPADYFQVMDNFGQLTLQSLINKRTVIKRSTKLILYWDIFRDFVLTGKLPDIVTDYMPQVQFVTFASVLWLLIQENGIVDVDSIVQKSLLGKSTVINILTDLTMIGLVVREKEGVHLYSKDQEKLFRDTREFFQKHIVYRALIKFSYESFSLAEYLATFNMVYKKERLSEKTQKIYAQRILSWLLETKLIIRDGYNYRINFKQEAVTFSNMTSNRYQGDTRTRYSRQRSAKNKNADVYWAQVSPKKVKELYSLLYQGLCDSVPLIASGHKKTLEDLVSLDAIIITPLGEVKTILSIEQLFEKVRSMRNIGFAIQQLQTHPSLNIQQIGGLIDEAFNKHWSDETKRVTGGVIFRWAKELSEATSENEHQL